jgi:hypothetical protein
MFRLGAPKSKAEQQQAIVEQYGRLFKCKEADTPIAYTELNWSQEEFLQGGPVAVREIRSFEQVYKHAREPFGKLHFAGTELATHWVGYMDGAIEAGERAADEVSCKIFGETQLQEQVLTNKKVQSAGLTLVDRVLATAFDLFAWSFLGKKGVAS